MYLYNINSPYFGSNAVKGANIFIISTFKHTLQHFIKSFKCEFHQIFQLHILQK